MPDEYLLIYKIPFEVTIEYTFDNELEAQKAYEESLKNTNRNRTIYLVKVLQTNKKDN